MMVDGDQTEALDVPSDYHLINVCDCNISRCLLVFLLHNKNLIV